jgi:uncharacterized membrane protein YfcA
VGVGVGLVFGLFGAGGSAFAAPVLALIGVPGVLAVASPLPALLPASVAGARRHMRAGTLDRRTAKLAIAGGLPGTIVGALASGFVGGHLLLVLSAIVLLVVGVRLVSPDSIGAAGRASARRDRGGLIVLAAFAVGVLTGLLANGGGFLLVPLFILAFGLSAKEAAGTSMVAIGVMTIPTLATHWALGHIDWPLAMALGLGVLPGSLVGMHLSRRLPGRSARWAFGVTLVAFSCWFLVRQFG